MMSIAARNMYQLIDGVLDEGLHHVGLYLEKMIKRSIFIADQDGHICYPDQPGRDAAIDAAFIQIPAYIRENDYYYEKLLHVLFYQVQCNGTNAFIIVQNLPVNKIQDALAILGDVKLAVKCYFSKIYAHKISLETELAEYLTGKSNNNLIDIIKRGSENLDPEAPYFAALMKIDNKAAEGLHWPFVHSYTSEFFRRLNTEIISVNIENSLIIIIPDANIKDAGNKHSSLEICTEFKFNFERKFNISSAQCIGNVYPLANLGKSYTEANLAYSLLRLQGEENFVQRFSDLGIFALIFSLEAEALKNFCFNSIGKLIEYDQKKESELIATLRALLDNCFSIKEAADNLFVHINTMYYRISKIEEIMGVNLSDMSTRVNLYLVMKVWDTLKMNGYIQNEAGKGN